MCKWSVKVGMTNSWEEELRSEEGEEGREGEVVEDLCSEKERWGRI